ncbi:pseudouridine synthase [Bradymonas sediminis]|uniref:Pseudouridine synthase n=1 Tax=Bradymonas sediminis TaxID=1548548 RepID=A0A2Z4FIZ8_9DELT|nr:pseudouridine synthase [Bradymonas sediminis]AWV88626.1 rRNA pseudouridine synthase [Bradymonas sediminis]TDP63691.1 23S rRNA pseudouridine2605 synthase [Bradymonas sediminis]
MIPRRLDKYLADATNMSRREVYLAWDAERIEVRPSEAPWGDDYEPWSLIFAEDTVLLDGEPLELREPQHYFAFHKPEGVLTAVSDPHDRLCLAPWLAKLPPSIFPVGRLDRPTTGFLLLTDDGNLSFCLLRPWFGVPKEYHLRVRGRVLPDDERIEMLLAGVDIGDGKDPATALKVEVLADQIASDPRIGSETLLSVVVDEGRNRMVRRMARGVGFKLEHLHRPRIGPVEMGEVAPGEWRRLSEDEVDALWDACGGRADARKRHIAALGRHAETWRAEGRPHHRLERWLENL